MSRGYLVFTRQTGQPWGLADIRRGNDWRMQQALLHQIKAIEFPGVNTTRWFATAQRQILVAFHGATGLARRFCLTADARAAFLTAPPGC